MEKADTSIFRWKSGHVGPEFFFLLKKINLINVLLKKRYQKIHINKVQNEPDDYPVSVDLNSNNNNLNLGSNCALFQLKSTCPLTQRKIDVSAFWSKNRRVCFSNEKSTCRPFQGKIDVSAFPTENRRVGFFHQADEIYQIKVLKNFITFKIMSLIKNVNSNILFSY